MPYIGKTPTVGNFQVCDAISVVNGQAAYTLQVGGVNVAPESANHMLVSLNGILQKPGSSFTISGSTMTFASNLATGDVIDFVQILGNVLDLGQPSDNTVTAAKLATTSITGQTAETSAADADTILIHDDSASALRKMTRSNFLSGVGGTNTPAFCARVSSAITLNDATTTDVTYQTEIFDVGSCYNTSNGVFTVPSGEGGKYFIYTSTYFLDAEGNVSDFLLYMNSTVGGSASQDLIARAESTSNATTFTQRNLVYSIVIPLSAGDTVKIQAYADTNDGSTSIITAGQKDSIFGAFKIIE